MAFQRRPGVVHKRPAVPEHVNTRRGEIFMSLRPLHDHVLIRRIDETEAKVGSIIIPDSAKEKPQQGEVIAVGNGKLLDNGERAGVDVKAGDRILFGKYGGSDIRIEGEDYLMLREDEILGVLA
jgi:chaperonin GroES